MVEKNLTAEPGKQEIVITGVFDAPRDLVWKACTDPNLISEWWGPKGTTTTVEKMDVRPGGTWRVVQRDAGGNTFAMHGVFHDVTPPERVVDTVEYEGMPGHVVLETETLEDLGDGRTKMTDRLVFQTVEDRDMALQSEMKEEMVGILDLLADLLENLKTQKQAAPAR